MPCPADAQDGANPDGLPIEVFDGIRAGFATDRSQFYKDLSAPFYGANRRAQRCRRAFETCSGSWSMQVGIKGAYDCIKAFSETDFTEDLKRFDIPTLIIHGDDDQIVPIADSALLSSKMVKGAILKDIREPPMACLRRTKPNLTKTCCLFLNRRLHCVEDRCYILRAR